MFVHLDAQAGSRRTNNVRFDEPSTTVFVEEVRERCNANTDSEARKEVCVTWIEEVDDVEHEKLEEQRNRDR